MWDTSRDDPLLATTKIDDLFHREPITSVRDQWVFAMCAPVHMGCRRPVTNDRANATHHTNRACVSAVQAAFVRTH